MLATPRWNSTVGGCRPARPYRRSCRSFLHLLFNQRPDEEEEEEDEAVGSARSANPRCNQNQTDTVCIALPMRAIKEEWRR